MQNQQSEEMQITIGKRLTWITIFQGKIQFMTGKVVDIIGDSFKAEGENAIGHRLSDILGINDKTIKWL